MKRIAFTICSAALLLISCNNSDDKPKTETASAEKEKMAEAKPETPAPVMIDSATAMKNWQAYMTPGEVHKMMASWNGTWKTEITAWEKPGAAPVKSTGTAVNKMILGGRYQESVSKANMMGMPFEGHGLLGYDNVKKIFENTWVDNMGTGTMKMSGPWDDATKTVTLIGKAIDPSSLVEKDYRETFNVIDDKTQLMTMYGSGPDGKEFKMMEIKFTRK